MKKIKILAISLFSLMLLLTGITPAFAITSKEIKTRSFYTNLNGVELTKVQYNNLAAHFDEDTLATMTQDQVNRYADDNSLISSSSSKYYLVDTVANLFGSEISATERELTEDQAMNYLANPPMQTFGTYHQTTMKKITITVVVGAINNKAITVVCEWLSGQMPATRSHDVIAIRIGSAWAWPSTSNSNLSGYLKHNGSIVQSYNKGSGNVLTFSNGVGLSMPLPSGGTSLSHGLTIDVVSQNDPFYAYGTFQHAQSAVTLAQSKGYTLKEGTTAQNVWGNVLYFSDTTIRDKYDKMSGVDCKWSLGGCL